MKHVLVTDFDGTMTNRDFYSLVVAHRLPRDMPDHWVDYRAGKITHFEALRRYFAAIPCDERSTLELLNQMQIDPNLKAAADRLQKAGWEIVVASAGCRWYIDKLLADAKVSFDVYANPGRFENGRGLQMELPTESPFFSLDHGIHKAGIVQHFIELGAVVAFAGDGFPDVDAARAVASDLRFARRDLADELDREREAYQSYHVWSDIADHLIDRSKP